MSSFTPNETPPSFPSVEEQYSEVPESNRPGHGPYGYRSSEPSTHTSDIEIQSAKLLDSRESVIPLGQQYRIVDVVWLAPMMDFVAKQLVALNKHSNRQNQVETANESLKAGNGSYFFRIGMQLLSIKSASTKFRIVRFTCHQASHVVV